MMTVARSKPVWAKPVWLNYVLSKILKTAKAYNNCIEENIAYIAIMIIVCVGAL